MKKLFYLIIGILFIIPNIVLATSTYDKGVDIANKYIYDFSDYARYIKVPGELPYEVDASNKLVYNMNYKMGGFLNEKEYLISLNNNDSWLAPGIGYWLVDRKVLDVMVGSVPNVNAESGVRITEFTKHDVKVKGSGTKTNPWYYHRVYGIADNGWIEADVPVRNYPVRPVVYLKSNVGFSGGSGTNGSKLTLTTCN